VAELLPATNNPAIQSSKARQLPTTKQLGDQAEARACDHLRAAGYQIVARNWKTKACEIDIVATRAGRLYFVEVKYRQTDEFGDGLAAVTRRKLAQMKRGGELYVQLQGLAGADWRLATISVAGADFTVQELIVL
jgi:Holliday junction resolvase-like predicted endonuclease